MPQRLQRGRSPAAGLVGRDQSSSQNGSRPPKLCNTCHKTGHIARDCRSTNGGQNNSQTRGQQPRGNSPQNSRQVPANADPFSECYMHGGHPNSECGNRNNVFSNKHTQGAIGNDSQVPRRHRDALVDSIQQTYLPSSEKYCPRCNQAGHTATECTAPAPALTSLRCIVCKNSGHTHQNCKHPNACHKCRNTTHTTAACRQAGSKAEELRQWVLNQRDTVPEFPHTSWASAWVASHQDLMAGHGAHSVGLLPRPTTTTWWNNTTTPVRPGHKSPATIQAESAEQILADIRRSQRAEYENSLKAKFAWAKANYNVDFFNDKIQEIGRNVYANGVGNNVVPKVASPANMHPAMAELIDALVSSGNLITADNLIRSGWTFFRDPYALESVFKKEEPVCNCCGSKGTVRDARFDPVSEDQNLVDIADWADWGVNVSFVCECARHQAYTYYRRDSSVMDLD